MDWLRALTAPALPLIELTLEGWSSGRGGLRWPEVPAFDPSLRVALEATVDRGLTLSFGLITGVPSPSVLRRVHSEAHAARELFESEGWLADPESYHETPGSPDEVLIAERISLAAGQALGFQHLAMASGYSPHPRLPGRARWLEQEANRTAHAWVLEHPGAPRPWLVCVHGFGMGSPTIDLVGFRARWLHEKLGLNLAFACLPLHGPRGEGRLSGSGLLSPDYLNIIHMFTQSIWDVRRVLAWVRGRDPRGVGLYGLSLGAHVASVVAGLEQNLACVIAGIPAVDFPNLARDNESWVMRRTDREFHVDWADLRGLTHVVSPLSHEPRLERERRFIFAGLADCMARPDQARALWRHWDRPEIHWYPGSHIGFAWRRDVRDFVESALRRSQLV